MSNICTGIDVVDIKDFERSLKNGGQNFLNKLFTKKEQQNKNIVHLAGIFAAKEAVLKALSLKPGKWLETEILYEKTGRPYVHFYKDIKSKSFDLSISHTKTTAVAVFVAIF